MSSKEVINLNELNVACRECSLYQLCLPAGLEQGDLEKLDQVVERRRMIHRGEKVYHTGDALKSLYAIRSGSFKSTILTESGDEQVVGFHLPGELVGFDAISEKVHQTSIEALDTSSICELPFENLTELALDLPSLNMRLFRIMSKEISRETGILQLLGSKNAAGRMASFLLNLSERLGERKLSESEFNMVMSRHDIANFLGLAVETVSRSLTSFQDSGVLKVNGKFIEILDFDALCQLAGRDPDSPYCRHQSSV